MCLASAAESTNKDLFFLVNVVSFLKKKLELEIIFHANKGCLMISRIQQSIDNIA